MPGRPTSRCAVLGDPIEHSLSPVLHRAGYAQLGLDWSYDAHRVPAGGLREFVEGLEGSWRGLSLTMPLKREALGLVDRLTPTAAMAGAVNTLLLGDEVVGDNTDLPGAVAAIRERTDVVPTEVVVLGGGATATSVGLALCDMGARTVRVLVRSPERAVETTEALRRHHSAPRVEVGLLGDPRQGEENAQLVVSTIPALAQDERLVERFASVPVLFDVIYDPWPTPLARASSGVVVSGLDLLVHQAALQFTEFTGREAPLDAMRAAGEQALTARQATAR